MLEMTKKPNKKLSLIFVDTNYKKFRIKYINDECRENPNQDWHRYASFIWRQMLTNFCCRGVSTETAKDGDTAVDVHARLTAD